MTAEDIMNRMRALKDEYSVREAAYLVEDIIGTIIHRMEPEMQVKVLVSFWERNLGAETKVEFEEELKALEEESQEPEVEDWEDDDFPEDPAPDEEKDDNFPIPIMSEDKEDK